MSISHQIHELVHLFAVLVVLLSLFETITCFGNSDNTDDSVTVLYVKPDNLSHCPDWVGNGSMCETLSYYVEYRDKYFVSNTCVEFLEGTHIMKTDLAVHLENVSNFSLVGFTSSSVLRRDSSDESPKPLSQITCSPGVKAGFYFVNSSNILVENLAITKCGQPVARRVRVLAALAFDTVSNVEILGVRIHNCVGFGVHGDRMLGNSTIQNSAFVRNIGTSEYYGGNVRLWYQNCPPNIHTFLQIKSSWFKHGFDIFKSGDFYPSASGLTLLISCPFVNAVLTNIVAVNNSADDGGNLAIELGFSAQTSGNFSVLLQDSRIINGMGHRGGGLRVWSKIPSAENVTSKRLAHSYKTLRVVNTKFIGNHARLAGGALYISHYEQECIDCVLRTIEFESCIFRKNSVPAFGNGAVVEAIKHKIPTIDPHVSPQFQVSFNNCHFTSNWVILDERNLTHGSILDIFSIDRVNFFNCSFTDNNSTALSSVDSSIVLSGELIFRNNSAVNGGAIKFCDSSYMYININASVLFEGNHASNAGGAIFAQQRCLESAPSCFFQPLVEQSTKVSDLGTKIPMSLIFVNNSANTAGNALYGGSIDYCYTFKLLNDRSRNSYYLASQVFDKIFNITNNTFQHDISSSPYGVCLCDEKNKKPTCKKRNKPVRAYPGEVFQVMAVTVGQRSGFSPAIVKGVVLGRQSDGKVLKDLSNEPVTQCTLLNYSIHTRAPNVTFNLTVQTASLDNYFRYHYPQVVVQLKPCPWGFKLRKDSDGFLSCQCIDKVAKSDISCNLTTGTMTREKSTWVGFNWSTFKSWSELRSTCQNDTSGKHRIKVCRDVILTNHCPYDYCNHSKVSISAYTTDKQCSFDRTGVLCGACIEGKSNTFGGSVCRGCNNDGIVPIVISFIAAGFILVFVLTALNLTVTEGSMNGLIFYMNIIQASKSLYFPSENNVWYGVKILIAIVAWFNLDLGVPICFFNGMDTYVKTWLQFVFPVYLWLIVAGIIILSRKFVLVQQLVGKNAVKILATLFLLSAAKLSRAIILVFSYVRITLPGANRSWSKPSHVSVWKPDGSVWYLSGKHIPLFIVGCLFLILILCYTVLVMFNMCLQKLPNRIPFSLINRLKPFFDAHSGPYKNRYRFWTGLLLLTRCILFVTYAANAHNSPVVNLTLTSITCFVFLSLMVAFYGVYRRLYLEMLAFLNLGVVSTILSYLTSHSNSDLYIVVVSAISVLVACAIFIFILVSHGYRQIRSSKVLRRFLSSLSPTPSHEDLLSPLLGDGDGGERATPPLTTQTELVISTEGEGEARRMLQDMNSVAAVHGVPEVATFSKCREPLIDDDS